MFELKKRSLATRCENNLTLMPGFPEVERVIAPDEENSSGTKREFRKYRNNS